MKLFHRSSGVEVSVVYRVPDDLNDLNGLNCLNEQRSLPSGLEVGMRVLVSRDRRAIREKIETEPKIRKWFEDLTRLSYLKSTFDPWLALTNRTL
jgi:hypothetical protein